MRPYFNLGLGRLYQVAGQRRQAQVYLATATAMYRERDMREQLEITESMLS